MLDQGGGHGRSGWILDWCFRYGNLDFLILRLRGGEVGVMGQVKVWFLLLKPPPTEMGKSIVMVIFIGDIRSFILGFLRV